jgi:hypothetical protein
VVQSEACEVIADSMQTPFGTTKFSRHQDAGYLKRKNTPSEASANGDEALAFLFAIDSKPSPVFQASTCTVEKKRYP